MPQKDKPRSHPRTVARTEGRTKPRDKKRNDTAIEAAKKPERIAKFMARAGVASRRGAEVMIEEGRVTVNGETITSPALNVTPSDIVTVNGKPLYAEEEARLFLYHKPEGLMTTHKDPEGRPTVFSTLPKHLPRVVSVGRLDLNSEGLLLLTTSGELAHTLENPNLGWKRRYRVRAYGEITESAMNKIRDGVVVDGMHYRPAEIELESRKAQNAWYIVTLTEGKNREIRNIFARFDCKVSRLIRTSFGPFQLGMLKPGEVKEVPMKMVHEQLGKKDY